MNKTIEPMMTLDRLNTTKPTLTLAIYEAAIDWEYKDDEAKQPENVPYFCELTAAWQLEGTPHHIVISTHGLIYAQADETNPTKFKGWNVSSFEIDDQMNGDTYDLENKQDNSQDFEFDCQTEYDNHAEISQAAADILETIADDLASYDISTTYPNGVLELIGLEL